ncbi:hypothetical protein GGF31_000585 [Allomyces arbusculus]|nr:hypothetical protein GGF31_000585 [Allomyces arbusculus]
MADRIANARGAHWSSFVETHGMSPQSMVSAVDRLSESIMASMLKTVVREVDAVLSEFAETLFGQEMGM